MSQEALEKIKAMNVENIFSNISLWAHAKERERDDSFFPSIAVLKSNFTHVQQRNRMQFHVFAALLFYAFSSALTILPTIILKCTVAYLAYQTRWYTNFLHHFSSGVIIGIRSNIYSNESEHIFTKIWAHLSKCQSLFDRWKQILLLCRWVNASARALVRIFRQSNLFWLAKCAFSSDEWSKMHNTRFCVYVPP